jgi:hypothetical protein
MTTLKDLISARLAVQRIADELRSYAAPGKFYFTRNGFDGLAAKQRQAIEEYAYARTERGECGGTYRASEQSLVFQAVTPHQEFREMLLADAQRRHLSHPRVLSIGSVPVLTTPTASTR